MTTKKSKPKEKKEKPQKFSTYMSASTRLALKRFAVEKGVYEYEIIDAALRKCLPKKLFE